MTKPNYKYTLHDLQLIKFGLKFGLIKKEEIIAAADREIMKDGAVNYFWIEISLLSNKPTDDLISLIANKTPEPLTREDMLSIFKLTHNKLVNGSITTELAMQATVMEFRTSAFVNTYEHGEMNGLDYYYCNGIDEGWSSIEDVKKKLLEFLEQYNLSE